MKTRRILYLLTLSVLLLGLVIPAYAQSPELVENTNVTPDPVVAGSTVYIASELTYTTAGTATVRLCVPRDWASQATLDLLTPTSTLGEGWGTGTAAGNSAIGGVQTYCSDYSTTTAAVGGDSGEWSFTVLSTATTGNNRPVRVWITSNNSGNPPLQTIYTTVQGAPTTRYIGDTTGDCGGNTPCDTGVGALAAAVTALSSGGTIVVCGTHTSSGDVSVGAQDYTLQPLNSSAELSASGACANELIEINGTGDLTIDGLTLDGTGAGCGIGVYVSGSGNLAIQDSASSVKNWSTNGAQITGGGSHTISNSTFNNNGYGLEIGTGAGTVAVSNSTFSSNTSDGIRATAGTLMVEGSTFSSNGIRGIWANGASATVRGNTFSNNTSYGFTHGSGTLAAYANNLTGNNSNGYQAYVTTAAAAAKNWWGSHSDSSVGPTSNGTTSYAAGWSARLGADVSSWAAGSGSATLGNAALSGGTGDGVIISFGRGSANAPFDNGVPPYVNRVCSDYYDFYGVTSGSGWTVQLPIDNSTDCIANVLNYELAYVIGGVGDCTTSNNTACWDKIDEAGAPNIVVSGNNLLITGVDLAGTHIVAGDSSGNDPTAITLTGISAAANGAFLPVLVVGLALVVSLGAVIVVRKRR